MEFINLEQLNYFLITNDLPKIDTLKYTILSDQEQNDEGKFYFIDYIPRYQFEENTNYSKEFYTELYLEVTVSVFSEDILDA